MFCGKTTRSKCPRFGSLQQLLSSQSGLQQKWRGVDGAVSLGRGVEAGSRTDENYQGSYNQQSSIHRVAAALGVEIGLAACFVARLRVRSALVSALCNSFSALTSKNSAVLTVLSVWEEAWRPDQRQTKTIRAASINKAAFTELLRLLVLKSDWQHVLWQDYTPPN